MAYYDPAARAAAAYHSSISAHHHAQPFLSGMPASTDALSTFNPKQISQAAARPISSPKKPPAPYFHLNFHYNPVDALPSARGDAIAICSVTKVALKRVRVTAGLLRVPELFCSGAILCGMLFMKHVDSTTGWICRIVPGIAILHILYNLYHVSGSYRMRAPKSAVTYHLLSCTVDAVLVGFYAYAAIVSWQQHSTPKTTWTTVYGDGITSWLVLTLFIVACTSGAFTLGSLATTAHLIRCFRVLARLPPDANPFFQWDDTITRKPPKEKGHDSDSGSAAKRWSASTGASTDPTTPLVAEIATHPPWNWSSSRQSVQPESPASQRSPTATFPGRAMPWMAMEPPPPASTAPSRKSYSSVATSPTTATAAAEDDDEGRRKSYTRHLRRDSATVSDDEGDGRATAALVTQKKPARRGFRIRALSEGEEDRPRPVFQLPLPGPGGDDGGLGVPRAEDEGYHSMSPVRLQHDLAVLDEAGEISVAPLKFSSRPGLRLRTPSSEKKGLAL